MNSAVLLFHRFYDTYVNADKGQLCASVLGGNKCGLDGCMIDTSCPSKNRSPTLPIPWPYIVAWKSSRNSLV